MIMKGQAEEGHRRKTGGKEISMSKLSSQKILTPSLELFPTQSGNLSSLELPGMKASPGITSWALPHINIFSQKKLYLIQWDYAVNKRSNLWNVYGSNISFICLQLVKAHKNKLNMLSLHTTAWIEEIKNKVKWNNLWKCKWNYTKIGRKSSVCSGFFIFMNTTVF